MWRRVHNFVSTLKTYPTLSPDARLRRRVNRWLNERPLLTIDEWFQSFWQGKDIAQSTVQFAYQALSRYSGLEFGRVLPGDRLEADLHWTQVCWFDWELCLYDDVHHQFGVDISDQFPVDALFTVADLIYVLDEQIRQRACLS